MSGVSGEVIDAARSRIGKPFRHHYKPGDSCSRRGKTLDYCMQNGMDDRGYDCSGLVIASVCEIVGVETSQWPRRHRHLLQMLRLQQPVEANFGDMLLFYAVDNEDSVSIHTGILSGERQAIHASGISSEIEEGEVEGNFSRIATVPLGTLVELAQSVQA